MNNGFSLKLLCWLIYLSTDLNYMNMLGKHFYEDLYSKFNKVFIGDIEVIKNCKRWYSENYSKIKIFIKKFWINQGIVSCLMLIRINSYFSSKFNMNKIKIRNCI